MELSFESVSPFLNSNLRNLQFLDEDFSGAADSNSLDRICDASYESFFVEYLLPNKPIIIPTNIQNWKSKQEWISNSKPNFVYLVTEFGSADVPVADCDIKDYNSQLKSTMKFKDYIEFWKKLKEGANDNCPSLYLKDWHFNRNFPKYGAYVTPSFFKSDWLNEFCEKENDDYQFVYMGPKGTWTPLHADVFGSYSWSVNICGRKRWLLFPPGTEKLLQNKLKQLIYNVDLVELKEKKIQHYDIVQEVGEIIFVPSGWHHQVWNLEDTISINHNWFNGCNIHYIWKCLHKAALDVKKEISDCKDDDHFEEQLQLILKVHHGMNYEGFLEILNFIFKSRVSSIQNHRCKNTFWHDIFDIACIRNVCGDMMKNELPSFAYELTKTLQDSTNEFLNNETVCR